jgi:hypothetical protein
MNDVFRKFARLRPGAYRRLSRGLLRPGPSPSHQGSPVAESRGHHAELRSRFWRLLLSCP